MTKKNHERKKASKFLAVFFVIVILGIAGVILLDWQNIKEVIYEANLLFVVPAIILSLLSYVASSFAFIRICRMFNIKAPQSKLLQLGFITTTIASLIDLGGVGGYAVRISYLKNEGIHGKTVLAISILHTYLGFLTLLGLLISGLSYLFYNGHISFAKDPNLFYGIAFALFIILILTILLVIPKLREILLKYLTKFIKILTSQKIDEKVQGFHDALEEGLAVIKNRKPNTLVILTHLLSSWLLAAASLYFCFLAFGQKIKLGVLIAGFSSGIFAGMFSFIPGGVGAQDGSMSGIFTLVGIPFTTALLTALLFRVVFNIFPNLISIFLYGRLLNDE